MKRDGINYEISRNERICFEKSDIEDFVFCMFRYMLRLMFLPNSKMFIRNLRKDGTTAAQELYTMMQYVMARDVFGVHTLVHDEYYEDLAKQFFNARASKKYKEIYKLSGKDSTK